MPPFRALCYESYLKWHILSREKVIFYNFFFDLKTPPWACESYGDIDFCQEQGRLERQEATWNPFLSGFLSLGLALIDLTDRRTRLVIEILWNLTHVVSCSGVVSSFLEDFFLCLATSDKVAINTDIPTA